GYMAPSWPAPWGRDADALELLVIEDEFRAAKMTRPNIGVGGWALPNLIVHGTEAQQKRWILPTLRGEIGWCQLFSEPGAGSALANERVYMGSSNTIGGGVVGVLALIEARGQSSDRLVLAGAGELVATGHALAALGFRLTLLALRGADPSGSEAAVRKLL